MVPALRRDRPPPGVGAFCLLALLAWPGTTTAPVTVDQVRDPRPGGWVTDQTRTLPPATIAEIDRVAARVREGGGELVVVMVESVAGAEPRRFATELGNRWDLDPRGVLLFVAKGDRAAEIVLGNEVDSTTNVQASQEIMDATLVPALRAGRYGRGLLAAARELEGTILGQPATGRRGPPPAAAPGAAAKSAPLLEDPAPAAAPPAEAPPAEASTASPSRPRGTPAPSKARRPGGSSKRDSTLWPALGCLSFIVLLVVGGLVAVRGGARALRGLGRRPCRACGVDRVLLGEAEDDAHLSAPERLEESLGSVDYRLWACPSCGDVLKQRKQKLLRSHQRCGACGYLTSSRVRTVLEEATTYNEGLVEVVVHCESCGHHATSHHSTPRRSQPTPSASTGSRAAQTFGSFGTSSSGRSSGSSGSSRGSSSGSSSRSSSSGRKSFSSGRGASGRW